MQSTDRSGAQVEGTGGVGARVLTLMALETLHGRLVKTRKTILPV